MDMPAGTQKYRVLKCPKVGQVTFYPARDCRGRAGDREAHALGLYAVPGEWQQPRQFLGTQRPPGPIFWSLDQIREHARRRGVKVLWVDEMLWE